MKIVALALALSPADVPDGASWTCTATEKLDSHNVAMLQAIVYPSGERGPPSFFINWLPAGGDIAKQQLAWYAIPRGTSRLWKPDSIAFEIPAGKPDRKGHLVLRSAHYVHTIRADSHIVRSLRPTFSGSWVELQEWIDRTAVWAHEGWTVTAVDRRNKTLGVTEIGLPGATASQAAFTRLSAELERLESDPARHCHYNPPSYDSGQEISVSGSSGRV